MPFPSFGGLLGRVVRERRNVKDVFWTSFILPLSLKLSARPPSHSLRRQALLT